MRAELATLHRESFGWAMSCCRRDAFMAEEVLQRTYLKVLTGKARHQGGGLFKTWLFAVIRRTTQDERRREWLRRLRLLRYADHAQIDSTRSEGDDPAAQASAVEFGEMLAALSDRQRQVLQLVFYHEMSLSEAAETMGVSVGSARTHYDRAKKAIRLQLVENDDGPQAGKNSLASIVL
ncbi:MAG TPA: RNA polymerase sigma factor [Tepidisphaeraceae bacterium]|nr:RNA polymerase sigma factor [Tepidisphaeraceae bacterium]